MTQPISGDMMHTPHTSAERRVVAVRTLAWVLVAVSVYVGAGYLIAGPAVTQSDSYAALELVPGGMRTWGALLLAGAVAVAWGIGRDQSGHPRPLNVTLAIGVGYHLLWTFVIFGTWHKLGYIPSWDAPAKSGLLAVLYYICGRGAAPARDDR